MGLSKREIEDVETKVKRHDPIAQAQSLPSTTGRIEVIEEAFFPWLRERRRRRRQQS